MGYTNVSTMSSPVRLFGFVNASEMSPMLSSFLDKKVHILFTYLIAVSYLPICVSFR